MKHFLAVSVALLMLFTFLSPVRGQERRRHDVERFLEVGDSIRLDASGLGHLSGRFLLSNSNTITLTSESVPLNVNLEDIERLWVRGRGTGRGALVGLAAGGVGGIAVGLFLSAALCSDGGGCTATEVAAFSGVMGLVGGVTGLAVGAAIGASMPVWHLRIP